MASWTPAPSEQPCEARIFTSMQKRKQAHQVSALEVSRERGPVRGSAGPVCSPGVQLLEGRGRLSLLLPGWAPRPTLWLLDTPALQTQRADPLLRLPWAGREGSRSPTVT